MKNKLSIFLISAIFLFLFIVLFRGLNNSNIYTPNTSINNVLAEFKAQDFFTSETVESKNLFSKNEFYLVNIWASWCLPCREEHMYLIKLQNQNSLKLIGINYKDQKQNAYKFLKELNNPFDEVINDKDGTISIIMGAYGVPETFLVKNKMIIKKIIGPINEKTYLEILKKINEKK